MGAKKTQKTAGRSASRSIIGKIKTRLGINNSKNSSQKKDISSKKSLSSLSSSSPSTKTKNNNQQNEIKLKKSTTTITTTTATTSTVTSEQSDQQLLSPTLSLSSLQKKPKSSSSTAIDCNTTSSSNNSINNSIDSNTGNSRIIDKSLNNTNCNVKQRKISLNAQQNSNVIENTIKNCSNSTSSSSSNCCKSTLIKDQLKTGEDKAKAINKMLKNLDIKISGFNNILPDEKKIVECCNASISEVVKTKYRAAAVKTSTNIMTSITGPVTSKSLKKDDCNQTNKDKEISETSSSSSLSFSSTVAGCGSESTITKMSQNEMIKSNCSDVEIDKMTKNNETLKLKKYSMKKDDENQSNTKKCFKNAGESGQQTIINRDNKNASTTTSSIKKYKNKTQIKSSTKVSSIQNEKLNDTKEIKGKSTLNKTEKDLNISKMPDEDINNTALNSNEQKVIEKKTKILKTKTKDSSIKITPENRKKMKMNIAKGNVEQDENGQISNDQELNETKESEMSLKNTSNNDDDKLKMKSDNNLNVKKKQKKCTTAVSKKNEKLEENSSIQKKCKKMMVKKSPPTDKLLSEQVKSKAKKKESNNEQNSKTTTAKKVKKIPTKKKEKNQKSNELMDDDDQITEKDKINIKSKCGSKTKNNGGKLQASSKNTDTKTTNLIHDKKLKEFITENLEKESILNMPKANDGIIEGTNENEKQNVEENISDTIKEISAIKEMETGKSTETNKTDGITEKSLETGKDVKSIKSSVDKNNKALSVRERLQKKYLNSSTFKVYKNLKHNTEKTVKKLEENSDIDLMKVADMMKSDKETKNESNVVKPEKDVYDFKTESEDEDNIKMNLLMNETVKALLENDFSDEDDKPLHLTKLELLEDEDNKPLSQCKEEQKKETIKQITVTSTNQTNQKRNNSPVKVDKKSSEQNEGKSVTSVSGGKIKEEKKQVKFSPKKTASNNTKRTKEKNDYHNSTSSESSTDSEENNLCLRMKANFGPKRMASLNALAKVQCLYENESRTAHELGLSKTMAIPKIKTLHSSSGSEEEKDLIKKGIQAKDQIKKEPTEYEPKRELRNAPGLRGVGKHWDFDDVSDFESGHESDYPYRKDYESKSKKKKNKVPKQKVTKSKEKTETKVKKTYKPQKKKVKTTANKKCEIESTNEEEKNEDSEVDEKNSASNKRKRDKTDDFLGDLKGILARKRMASLNASALVAATYDIERHLDRNLGSDCSSFESFPEDEKPQITTKETKNSKDETTKSENGTEENEKESGKENSSRPTSSSVVIVQDTDVTITGVYVNSSAGSGQESYCKMQYRVQSSVTEERVLCPTSIDPPKSYTPLGALSSMRPPGSNVTEGGQQSNHQQSTQPQPMVSQQPTTNMYQSPTLNDEQSQQNIHMYPSHHYHQSSTGLPTGISASHHQHHQELQQYPTAAHHHYPPPPPPTSQQLKYSHLQHHHHPLDVTSPSSHQPVTQLSQSRCESPLSLRYQSAAAYQSPIPPPPTISMSASGSSAFCAPMQQSHHDITGYYQPAGPLISPHILPPVPPPGNAALVSSKQVPSPLSSDPEQQLQQPSQSAASAAESSDSEVLITGGDLSTFRYSSQQPPTAQSQQQQQLSVLSSQHQQHQQSSAAAYTRSMHQMHYPPAYPPSYYTPYPGDAMCYSPPYQPYFPAKVYQSAPTAAYRRYPSYYQPGPPPPADLYEPPPSSAAPPPPTGSQLVPTGPTIPQHMEHYPGPPGFYSGFSPGGGQCYSRGIQPPYMDYPAPCPCPMQSCPKNVLTGPLIGSNNSGSNSNNSTVAMNNNNTTNNVNMNTNIITNSNNSSSISSKNANNNNSTQISQSQVNSNLNNLSQTLKSNKGPVSVINKHSITNSSKTSHNHILGQIESANIPSTNGTILSSNKSHLHHHHMHQCKMEIIEPSVKTDLSISSERKDERKNSQYEEDVVMPPVPPQNYTINDKLIEPDITVSPARGSTGLPTVPDQTDKAATAPVIPAIPVNSASHQIGSAIISRESIVIADTTSPTAVAAAAANNGNLAPIIGRKARIGKTMAREMMYGTSVGTTVPQTLHHHHQHQQHNVPPQQIFSHHHMHHHVPPASHHINSATESTMKVFQDQNSTIQNPTVLKPDLDKVKKEEIKIEEDDVVVILDDEKQDVKQIKIEPDIVEVIDDRTESEEKILSDKSKEDLFDINFKESRGVKRMKIHEFNKSQCKKSSPNGYKSLIKQTERKPYLCISRKPEKKEHYRKVSSKSGVKKRKLMLTEQQKNRLMIRKRKLLLMERERQEQKDDENSRKSPVNVQSPVKEVENKEESDSCIVISSPVSSPAAATTETDLQMVQQQHEIKLSVSQIKLSVSQLVGIIESSNSMAKGYSSEPDIRSTTTGRKTKKTKSTEARSKSESKKSAKEAKTKQQQQQTEQICSSSTSKNNQNVDISRATESKSREIYPQVLSTDSDSSVTHEKCGSVRKSCVKKQQQHNIEKITKSSKNAHKTKSSVTTIKAIESCNEEPLQDALISGDVRTINNNILEANNNNKLPDSTFIETSDPSPFTVVTERFPISSSTLMTSFTSEDLMPHVQPLVIHPTTKRQRSRTTRRFSSSRKRKRNTHVNDEVNDVIPLPRKLNVVPRWNNGWSWQGEPFQGKVFLNSDDPLVVRTCYPSMVHVEGDVIRPRDCVLLRAGSKKNELPYVAKVAHLWENPEDGEMMMSLLWYYRPEHTEQGRQPNDCSDEVFASRHRDHNSVACIEDKCYVLTFAEYCRYRRSLRAAEEGIDEPISIVPPLYKYHSPREVPINTNPELVMFCQRVYEFRLKRLLKTPAS